MKIAVLTTPYQLKWLKQHLEDCVSSLEFRYFSYIDLEQLLLLYGRTYERVDGFLVDSILSKHWITQTWPKCKKPVLSIDSDLVSLYKVILDKAVGQTDFVPGQYYLDFAEATLEQVRWREWEEQSLYRLGSHTKNIENLTLDQSITLQNSLVASAISSPQKQGAKQVLVTLSNLLEPLEKHQVPYIFIRPSSAQIQSSTAKLEQAIRLYQLSGACPAVIQIHINKTTQQDQSLHMILLEEALKNYKKNSLTDFILRIGEQWIEVFTSVRTVEYITSEYSECSLSKYLEKTLRYPVSIGYGLGSDLLQAQSRAKQAAKEAAYDKKNTCSFLVDEKGTMVGPLKCDRNLSFPDWLEETRQQIAKESGLSVINIQKLQAVLQILHTNHLTATDLSDQLGITIRSANRMLMHLCSTGYAMVVDKVQSTSRGRPKTVYEINLETPKNNMILSDCKKSKN